ncbi:MAG: iron chelate uptake ABC transporter family permease subunit, partial [Pseudomonadota bacterium]
MSSAPANLADSPAQGSTRRSRYSVLTVLATVTIAVVLVAVSIGAIAVSPLDALLERADRLVERTVLLEIRLPRVLLAAFVGAALAVAGAALQGLFRNPLADPSLIGVSGGAAVGAIAMIV